MSPSSSNRLIPADFTPVSTLDVVIGVADGEPDAEWLGLAVGPEGEPPARLGMDRDALTRAGFTGKVGEALVLTGTSDPALVAVGVGVPAELTAARLRDAAAAFARAARKGASIATDLAQASSAAGPRAADTDAASSPGTNMPDMDAANSPGANAPATDAARATALDPDAASAAVVEGALLARYRYLALKSKPDNTPLERLTLIGAASQAGADRGLALARAAMLARDLANTPPAHLTATRFAELARELGEASGLEVEVFDRDALIELSCGGLLGVNAGSAEEPRMVKLRYRPVAAIVADAAASEADGTPHLALVGKGITYDSGGLSLKPSDGMHALMKMDMSGGASVLAAMTALRELGCPTAVTGYLMCTDNMPSGSATKLGDVLTARGGTTIEVKNTDAEGRLVMADALALAAEEGADAIVDIATLTGACMVALGPSVAGLFGTDDALAGQLQRAASSADESVWRLPLERRYREQLNSDVADLSNVGGGRFGGAIIAALFLAEFVGDTPWAHLDIAGPMHSDKDDAWRVKGATGFGTRLLAEFACAFTRP